MCNCLYCPAILKQKLSVNLLEKMYITLSKQTDIPQVTNTRWQY